ncbi:MAG: DUF2075 domain-containing protein [Bacilli bacterium]|jgi:DUF2075 family protein|nr:DUF2075 domain-containing protein [Bacilli bacterium]
MAKIEKFVFDENIPTVVETTYFDKWPVVYVINDDEEVYIGETIDISQRTSQHLKKKEKQRLKYLHLISDDDYNKSVILDLESFLIKYFSADNKFITQNVSSGHPHNFYNRSKYQERFEDIWQQLLNDKLVSNSIKDIENSTLFKYSPYKSLSDDQNKVISDLISYILSNYQNNNKQTYLVNGGAGTGKTVVAMMLLKLLTDFKRDLSDEDFESDDILYKELQAKRIPEDFKVGLVIPMDNLRSTLKDVTKSIKSLKGLVYSPTDISKTSKDYFDLLIVDEAHRLRKAKNLTNVRAFYDANLRLGFDEKDGTELDWIKYCSKQQVLFYDRIQSIKKTDIGYDKFNEIIGNQYIELQLHKQHRCMGGNDYINYVKDIFNNQAITKKDIDNYGFEDTYDLKIFDDVNEMINEIIVNNEKYGLCRNVAGYAWKWISKKDKSKYDFDFNGIKYQWNNKVNNWVNSNSSINEIGSIHTIQGFDLNYCGVILGNDIGYDKINHKIIIRKDNYYDAKGKADTKIEDLETYIKNIYLVLLTRGIMGTYIYVCDKDLREYLREYVK